jgi:hypothetical protein
MTLLLYHPRQHKEGKGRGIGHQAQHDPIKVLEIQHNNNLELSSFSF